MNTKFGHATRGFFIAFAFLNVSSSALAGEFSAQVSIAFALDYLMQASQGAAAVKQACGKDASIKNIEDFDDAIETCLEFNTIDVPKSAGDLIAKLTVMNESPVEVISSKSDTVKKFSWKLLKSDR